VTLQWLPSVVDVVCSEMQVDDVVAAASTVIAVVVLVEVQYERRGRFQW